jgi:hypothetical protein
VRNVGGACVIGQTLYTVPPVIQPLLAPSNRPSNPCFFVSPLFSARLKIKCDKQIPCQSCQVGATQYAPIRENSVLTNSTKRRGCASLCPNGPCFSYFLSYVHNAECVPLIIRQPCHWTGDPVGTILHPPPHPSLPSNVVL